MTDKHHGSHAPAPRPHAGHDHDDHDHSSHDHSSHDHGSHDHSSHDHAPRQHASHDHSSHDHGSHDHGSHGHGGHSHHGHHHHHGDPNQQGRAFLFAIGLNALFVAAEFYYGFIAHSTALMADAGHNLSDVLGLALAWGAAMLAKRRPNGRYTYGLRSSSILAALLNALLLMMACGAIGWEAVQRLSGPTPVAGMTVSIVAAVGVLVNGVSAWLFMSGSKDDLNVRAAYQHMAADAAISLGVVVAGLAIIWTGWTWLDPLASIVIVLLILASTWALLGESLRMVMAAVPDNVNAERVSAYLLARPGVAAMHDLHIWAMSTTETALTAHLVMPDGYPGDSALDAIVAGLKREFSLHHCTLQVEQGTTDHGCELHA